MRAVEAVDEYAMEPEMLSIQLLVISSWDWKAAFGFKNVAPVVPYPSPPLHADTKLGGSLPESPEDREGWGKPSKWSHLGTEFIEKDKAVGCMDEHVKPAAAWVKCSICQRELLCMLMTMTRPQAVGKA